MVGTVQDHTKTHQPYQYQVFMCFQSMVIGQTTYLLISPLTPSDVTQNQSLLVLLYPRRDASAP